MLIKKLPLHDSPILFSFYYRFLLIVTVVTKFIPFAADIKIEAKTGIVSEIVDINELVAFESFLRDITWLDEKARAMLQIS